jgi:carboxypeptidase Q
MRARRILVVAVLLVLGWLGAAAPPDKAFAAQDSQSAIQRIKDEGLQRSQVMQTLSYLTDVIGPRLTASPEMRRANEWTRDRLTSWGLQEGHLEAWGPFGRGWSLRRFAAQVVEPQCIPLIAYPKAWSPGTSLTAEVVWLDVKDEADLQKYHGRLKGAIVLSSPPREVRARFDPLGTRMTEKDLLGLADASPSGQGPGGPGRRRFQGGPGQVAQFRLSARKLQFLAEEGAAVVVEPSSRGDGGTIFVQSASVPQPVEENPNPPAPNAPRRISAWDKNVKGVTPQVVVSIEHYNRMVRMIQQGEKLKMAVDLAVQFQDTDPMGYNTIAEIPGTDLKDEVVMLGGHMDSWHSGTGATDNGAGVAVAMEAVRILEAAKLQPRRTVRIGLWSGEEEGLLGSRAYVAEHLGRTDPAAPAGTTPMLLTKPEYERFDAYFNLDNGTGKIRGVFLQGNEAVRPIFRQWLAPFRELGASTLSIANTGGTDHLSFDGIGLPGFQFIQDEIEYETRTHHSNQDVFDRAQVDDLKQAAVIMAAFVYNTATMDQRLPRKPRAGR